MPWQNQGGGSGGGGPWGGGPSPWGRGGGGGSQPPNLEEILRRGQDRFRRALPGGTGSAPIVALIVGVIAMIWLFSGTYRVQPDEQGVVLRFGALNRVTQSGLGWHIP